MGFTGVSMSDLDEIDGIRRKLPKMRFFYDMNQEILIVKFMEGVTHEVSRSLFGLEFDRVIASRTGLRRAITPVGSVRFKGLHRAKESDFCFKPTSWDLITNWPSVVIEVGVSESLTQLHKDARFWLECSGGQTHIVILISVNKRARSWVIKRWQQNPAIGRLQPVQNMGVLNTYSQTHVAMQVQSLSMQEGQIYAGASLIIPATLVLDVLPPIQAAPLGPNDFEMTAQMLNLLNEDLWKVTR